MGMGNAKQIPLSYGRMTYGGKHGISAAKSRAGARAVVRFVLERKVKPQPDGRLMIAKVLGRRRRFENRWRVIFGGVQILEVSSP